MTFHQGILRTSFDDLLASSSRATDHRGGIPRAKLFIFKKYVFSSNLYLRSGWPYAAGRCEPKPPGLALLQQQTTQQVVHSTTEENKNPAESHLPPSRWRTQTKCKNNSVGGFNFRVLSKRRVRTSLAMDKDVSGLLLILQVTKKTKSSSKCGVCLSTGNSVGYLCSPVSGNIRRHHTSRSYPFIIFRLYQTHLPPETPQISLVPSLPPRWMTSIYGRHMSHPI